MSRLTVMATWMLAGCGSGLAQAPAETAAPPAPVPVTPEAAPPSWLGPEVAPLPRWRFIDSAGRRWAVDPILGVTWALAWDAQHAVVHTDVGALVRSRADGIVGFVPRELAFVALQDGFVIVTHDGQTLRAPATRAAERDAYLSLDATRRWLDVIGSERVALDGGALLRSRDAGASWQPVVIAAPVTDARVRPDGTIVAQAGRALVVVAPEGRSSTLDAPASDAALMRYGAWILAASPVDIGRSSSGAVDVLGADRKRWVRAKLPLDILGVGFLQIVDNWLGYTATPADERWPATAPMSAPRAARPKDTTLSKEVEDSVASVMGFGPGGASTPRCVGTRCFHATYPELPGSQQVPRFLDDALCRARDACEPFLRAPLVAVFDRGNSAVRLERAPPTCVPEQLVSARGLVLLQCRDSLYSLGPAGWIEELARSGPRGSLYFSMADDGTLLMQEVDVQGHPLSAWLRAPVELGAARAWTEITRPDALWYAPRAGGRALAATSSSPSAVALWSIAATVTSLATFDVRSALDDLRVEGRNLDVTIDGGTHHVPLE